VWSRNLKDEEVMTRVGSQCYSNKKKLYRIQMKHPTRCMDAEVDVFPAVVGLLVTNKPTTAGNTSTSEFIRKPVAATAV
jgi:hypothetical protein